MLSALKNADSELTAREMAQAINIPYAKTRSTLLSMQSKQRFIKSRFYMGNDFYYLTPAGKAALEQYESEKGAA